MGSVQKTVTTAQVCLWLCTASVHNTTQNSSDNLPSYLQTTIRAQTLSTGERRKTTPGARMA